MERAKRRTLIYFYVYDRSRVGSMYVARRVRKLLGVRLNVSNRPCVKEVCQVQKLSGPVLLLKYDCDFWWC